MVRKNPLRIGVDATCWQNTRGYGRHARSLLSTLTRIDQHNQYTFFIDSPVNAETLPPEATVRMVSTAAPTAVAASSNGHRSLPDIWRMSRALSSPDFDLLLFPTIYSFVPVFSRARKVVMIHDVIPEKYPQLTLPSLTARVFWKTKVALGRWQADALITVSDFSRLGIVEHFKIDPEQVFVLARRVIQSSRC